MIIDTMAPWTPRQYINGIAKTGTNIALIEDILVISLKFSNPAKAASCTLFIEERNNKTAEVQSNGAKSARFNVLFASQEEDNTNNIIIKADVPNDSVLTSPRILPALILSLYLYSAKYFVSAPPNANPTNNPICSVLWIIP
jgi:hypothetical protein